MCTHLWIDSASRAASVAQLVKHPSRTRDVAGSNSAQGSSFFLKITGCFGCMHLPCIILHVYTFMYVYTCRSGFITAESLRAVCKDLGTPISDQEIAQLMAE